MPDPAVVVVPCVAPVGELLEGDDVEVVPLVGTVVVPFDEVGVEAALVVVPVVGFVPLEDVEPVVDGFDVDDVVVPDGVPLVVSFEEFGLEPVLVVAPVDGFFPAELVLDTAAGSLSGGAGL